MSYFGIPIRNGLPIGLGSVAPLASGGGSPFSPLSLFSGGTPGAWYDPSDYGATGTLFQDSAGTTPVTAVEQPVGLMLDKSQGLVATATAIDGNLNTATWTKGTGWSAPSARSLVCDGTQTATSDTTALYTKPTGALVRWSFTVSAISGTLLIYPTGGNPTAITTTGAKTLVSDALSNFNIFRIGAGGTCTITDIRIEIIAGNHAFQSTSASRPVLSARYNLLTKTEQFDDAAWSKNAATVAATGYTDPLGGNTARLMLETTANAVHEIYQSQSTFVSGQTIRLSVSAKANGRDFFALFLAGYKAIVFDLVNLTATVSAAGNGSPVGTVVDSGNGWRRCTYECLLVSTPSSVGFGTAISTTYGAFAGDASKGVYIWGADLRASNQSTLPYQRVNTATDYATTGFLPYLKFDGVDDSLSTNSISFTSTDKMSVFAGVRKLSDAAIGNLVELSVTSASNAGSFQVRAPASAGPDYMFASSGTTLRQTTATGFSAPITNTLTGLGDISGDVATLRVNGTEVASNTGDQGTGNYGTYPLYLGRRGGTTLPLNGQLYSMIIVGKAVNSVELTVTEAYVNQQTGAY